MNGSSLSRVLSATRGSVLWNCCQSMTGPDLHDLHEASTSHVWSSRPKEAMRKPEDD